MASKRRINQDFLGSDSGILEIHEDKEAYI